MNQSYCINSLSAPYDHKYSALLKITQEMLDLSPCLKGDILNYVKLYLHTRDLSSFRIAVSLNVESMVHTIRIDSTEPNPYLFPCAEAQVPSSVVVDDWDLSVLDD